MAPKRPNLLQTFNFTSNQGQCPPKSHGITAWIVRNPRDHRVDDVPDGAKPEPNMANHLTYEPAPAGKSECGFFPFSLP